MGEVPFRSRVALIDPGARKADPSARESGLVMTAWAEGRDGLRQRGKVEAASEFYATACGSEALYNARQVE
jgi:hypothetical protein